MTPALLVAVLLQATPPKETVPVPGTTASFDLVSLPGDGTLRPFSIGAREVTWGEFNAYALKREKGVDAVTHPSEGMVPYLSEINLQESFAAERPAVMLRWHSAAGYCEWLSKKTGRYFRLPTEREWEYAARAGESAAAPKALDDAAWHRGNSGKTTHAGGARKANAFGLYDMLGNVWEYCLEFESPPELRPLLRGGSWNVPATELSFASRRTIPCEWFQDDVVRPRSAWWLACNTPEQGFRVVCVQDGADAKECDAARPRIEVTILGSKEVQLKTGPATPDLFIRVKGRVKNGTGRPLDEVQLRVFYRTPEGAPHLTDEDRYPGRATFTLCWPVLAAGANPAPLPSGESRDFEVFIPSSFELEAPSSFGAAVLNLRFSKE